MTATFPAKKFAGDQEYTTTGGSTPVTWNMLGLTGAAGTGTGTWLRMPAGQWKSFILHLVASPHDGSLGSASVQIQATNVLDPSDPDGHSKFVVLGTLNSAGPSLVYEAPWRYVRAEVKAAGPAEVGVVMSGVEV